MHVCDKRGRSRGCLSMEKFKFLKNSALYFIGNSLSKVASLLLLPIYSEYLSPEDFGYFDLSQSFSYFIIPLLTFELFVSMLKFIKGTNDIQEKRQHIFSGLIMVGVVFTIAFLLLILSCFIGFIPYFRLILVSTVLMTLQRYYLSVCRANGQNVTFVISGIISSFTIAILNFIFLVWLKWHVEALYWSLILSIVFQIVYIELKTPVLRLVSQLSFNKKSFRELLAFSIPISVGSILYFLINFYNRIIIEQKIGIDHNGYFAIANRFSIILLFATSAFTMAWQDVSFEKSEDNQPQKMSDGINKYFAFIMLSALLLIFSIQLVFPYLIHKRYAPAYFISALTVIVTLFAAMGDFITQTFIAIKKSKFILISSIIGALLNVSIIGVSIDEFGMNGVNYSLICIYLINLLIRVIYLNTHFKFHISVTNILFGLVLIFGVLWVYHKSNFYYTLSSILVIFVIAGLYFHKDWKSAFNLFRKKVL